MRVDSEPLEADVAIDALRAQESCDEAGIHAGELVGFHCQHCDAVDETLQQIIHEEGCPLFGEHGRALYGDDLPQGRGQLEFPELEPDTEFTVYYSGWSGEDGNAKAGHIVAFRCDVCGNADEDLFEIVHDENCELAGRHSRPAADGAMVADGGRER